MEPRLASSAMTSGPSCSALVVKAWNRWNRGRPSTRRITIVACTLALSIAAWPAARAEAGTLADVGASTHFTLAGLQIPAIAFEFGSAYEIQRSFREWPNDKMFTDRMTDAYRAHLVCGILHSVKAGVWTLGGASLLAGSIKGPFIATWINGGLDIANAIIGVTFGAMILGSKQFAEVRASPAGHAATFSGVVHLVFGGIATLVALPEFITGQVGTIAVADRGDGSGAWIALSPGAVSLHGRF